MIEFYIESKSGDYMQFYCSKHDAECHLEIQGVGPRSSIRGTNLSDVKERKPIFKLNGPSPAGLSLRRSGAPERLRETLAGGMSPGGGHFMPDLPLGNRQPGSGSLSRSHFSRAARTCSGSTISGFERTPTIAHANRVPRSVTGLTALCCRCGREEKAMPAFHIEGSRRIRKFKGFPVLYHVTSAAQEIFARGFRDAITKRGPNGDYPAGVWLSNRPLDPNDGAIGDSVVLVWFGIPLRRLREFEWREMVRPIVSG